MVTVSLEQPTLEQQTDTLEQQAPDYSNLLTLAAYSRLFDQQGAFEIIDGVRIPKMPNLAQHIVLINLLAFLLKSHCMLNKLGEVFSEATFVDLYQTNWVKGSRIPDVLFFSAARWQAYIENTPDWGKKPFVLIPDLVVEVVSENDSFPNLQRKVETYLRDGVRLVWVIDPDGTRVTVYQGDRFQTLTKNDTLSGADVIPGFELKLAELFQ
jgi:Uma2 family endonuclease